ncbi:hypothetical protein DITRI_Ditri01bG0134600 [Diplodiscus trichospermus]
MNAVYGFNDGMDRRSLWAHLVSLAESFPDFPWILVGDFNVIYHLSKSSKFDGTQGVTADIKDFQDCMEQLAVFDHISSGPIFTWSNNQEENFIAKKLDRVLINEAWLYQFNSSREEFLPPRVSDHCSALIQIFHQDESPPKPFKFFNFWVKHPKFLGVVVNSWNESVASNPMVVLHKKLKRLKSNLKEFNRKHFAELSDKVKIKRTELESVQIANLSGQGCSDSLQKEEKLAKELHDLLAAEENFYKQKSKKLIGTKDEKVKGASSGILSELLSSFSKEACDEMCIPVTPEEIKQNLFSINGDKSPGPDGYTACFFKKAWPMVGDDVVKATSHFFIRLR